MDIGPWKLGADLTKLLTHGRAVEYSSLQLLDWSGGLTFLH